MSKSSFLRFYSFSLLKIRVFGGGVKRVPSLKIYLIHSGSISPTNFVSNDPSVVKKGSKTK